MYTLNRATKNRVTEAVYATLPAALRALDRHTGQLCAARYTARVINQQTVMFTHPRRPLVVLQLLEVED